MAGARLGREVRAHPPPGVRIVSFFVTARYAGQSDRTAFLDVVIEQLCEVAGRPLPQAPSETTRPGWFGRLLSEAADKCRKHGERLVLATPGLGTGPGPSGSGAGLDRSRRAGPGPRTGPADRGDRPRTRGQLSQDIARLHLVGALLTAGEFDRALEKATDITHSLALSWVRTLLAEARIGRGELEEAEELVLALHEFDQYTSRPALMRAWQAAGRPDRARTLAESATAPRLRMAVERHLLEEAQAAGEPERARAIAHGMAQIATALMDWEDRATAEWAVMEAWLTIGDLDEAEAAAR
ncbi:hypothetical protein [Streptomyces sp. NPDC051211]|uniref:hypothetical protein n=1 Tax=Streptomyces sp. NPDC051211 TaxID=3154643 RepID=UPI00344E4C78